MIKLCRKYLKPFIAMILLAICLLFVQAQTELALPDYMSKIITNGIQSGGFEDAVFNVVSEETMDTLKLFMSEEDQQTIDESYTLVLNQDIDEDIHLQYKSIYGNIYQLNKKLIEIN